MGFIALLLLLSLPAMLDSTEYDFCYKEVAGDSVETGCIVYSKAKDSNWSGKETGASQTGRGETLRVVTLDVSAADYASMTNTPSVKWFVNTTATAAASAITTTVLTP